MPTRINRPPYGLQDLLGNTALGSNPAELADDVRATMDIFPLWASERVSVTEVAEANTLGTQFDDVVVAIPDGELWLPRASAIEVVQNTPASTTTIIMSFGVDKYANRFGGLAGTVHLGTDGGFAEEKIMVPPLAQVWSYTWRLPTLYFSGTEFIWTVMKNSLPFDMDLATVSVEYVRLEI